MKQVTSNDIRNFVSKACYDQAVISCQNPLWPTISIVTPSFNQGQFLEKTILSVLNQNYPNLEYIVMDGASTDGSVDIIQKYKDRLAYWISQKDGGQADAIRKGFDKSTGKILAWLNSDDVYLPGTLHRIADVFNRDSDTDVVYGNEYLINNTDTIINQRRLTPYIPSISRYGLLRGGFWIYQPACFWKRQLYQAVGGVDPTLVFCMDNDLFSRFVLAGAKLRFVREFFTAFRIHPDSKTSTLQHVAEREIRTIQKKYCKHHSALFDRFHLAITRAVRGIFHLIQGDLPYLVNKFTGIS